MADRIRISRRRVMQLGIAAPLAAMQARGANAQELEAAAMTMARVKFPPGKLADFKRDAKKHCDKMENDKKKCEEFEPDAYGSIVLVLWAHFVDAVLRSGATLPEDPEDLATFVQDAYDTESAKGKSGEIVAENTKQWGDRWYSVTNYCAYRCGIYAAREAGVGNVVSKADYAKAFKEVSEEIKVFVLRIVDQTGKPIKITGGGC